LAAFTLAAAPGWIVSAAFFRAAFRAAFFDASSSEESPDEDAVVDDDGFLAAEATAGLAAG
jgi:hypothetical protein